MANPVAETRISQNRAESLIMRRSVAVRPWSGGQGGAAVRSATRSRAARARGLRAISSGRGLIGRRCGSRKLGATTAAGAGSWREARGAVSLRSPQEVLDPPVFERMERHDGEPPARHQQPLGRLQTAVELAELVVDGDAQRLKGAGRRVEPGLDSRHRGADDVGELEGALDRLALSRRDDGSGDPAGKALLAEVADQAGEIVLGKDGDEIGGALPGSAHAHVERPVQAKRKPASGAVELDRRDAEIKRDPGDRPGRHRPGLDGVNSRSMSPKLPSTTASRPLWPHASARARRTASGSRSIATTQQSAAASSARV